MKLETERLILRRWKPTDADPFRKINADARVMEHYPSILKPDESDRVVETTEKSFDKKGFGLFAVELKGGRFIGFVGLQSVPFSAHFTPAVEIAWRLAHDCWNKGYATEAAKATLKDAFSRLEMKEIVAMTVPENASSRKVMDKLGMKYDAKENFDNPRLPEGHKLRPHVLYRMKSDWFVK